jgi:hypothetical protein
MSIGFNTNPNSNGDNKKLQIPVDFRHSIILRRNGKWQNVFSHYTYFIGKNEKWSWNPSI